MAKKQTPVIVLTGCLGAGKSTLLNHLLTQLPAESRAAVIENEFGDSGGVENQIINPRSGDVFEEVFELSNGCVCCSMRGQLQQTLENLLTRPDSFDLVVVETTGMANPGPVAASFWMDEELESRFYLDAIIAVVDGKHWLKSLSDHDPSPAKRRSEAEIGHSADASATAGSSSVNPIERQIAYADRVLLNKMDLIRDDQALLDTLTSRVRQINPLAPVVCTERCRVPLASVVGIRAFDPSPTMREQMASDAAAGAGDSGGGHGPHPSALCTRTIKVHGRPIRSADQFEQWVGDVVWSSDYEVFRTKGLVWIAPSQPSGAGEPESSAAKFMLQGVYELFELTPVPVPDGGDGANDTSGRTEDNHTNPMESRVIFIGLNLPSEDELSAKLTACLA